MTVLVTAIGSMSAECVVRSLVSDGIRVIGTDLYPSSYNPISKECAAFSQMPKAYDAPEVFCRLIADYAKRMGAAAIIPLTDPEIDVLSPSRLVLVQCGISLWIPDDSVISNARNKQNWSRKLLGAKNFKTIPSFGDFASLAKEFRGEFVAKKIKGRSSEGIFFGSIEKFCGREDFDVGYLFQPRIIGDVVTVDFARHPMSKKLVLIPRKELLRTQNGAGTVVEIQDPEEYAAAVEEIANGLSLSGVMNCEFIKGRDGILHLMDINPRFSAGVSFSKKAGYDFPIADVACYTSEDIPRCENISVGEIMVKRYC